MKEKTFEELIEEKSPDIQFNDKHDWDLQRFSGNDMAEFGKQVREATIKEVQYINHNALNFDDAKNQINNLATDRIKTD